MEYGNDTSYYQKEIYKELIQMWYIGIHWSDEGKLTCDINDRKRICEICRLQSFSGTHFQMNVHFWLLWNKNVYFSYSFLLL